MVRAFVDRRTSAKMAHQKDFRQDGGSGERNVLSLALSKPSCGYREDTAWLQASKDFQGTRASNHGVPK